MYYTPRVEHTSWVVCGYLTVRLWWIVCFWHIIGWRIEMEWIRLVIINIFNTMYTFNKVGMGLRFIKGMDRYKNVSLCVFNRVDFITNSRRNKPILKKAAINQFNNTPIWGMVVDQTLCTFLPFNKVDFIMWIGIQLKFGVPTLV